MVIQQTHPLGHTAVTSTPQRIYFVQAKCACCPDGFQTSCQANIGDNKVLITGQFCLTRVGNGKVIGLNQPKPPHIVAYMIWYLSMQDCI